MLTPIAIQSEMPELPGPLRTIPDPGYEDHPAYGRLFPAPTLGLRVRALAKLIPWILFVAAKRLLLIDRLTLPHTEGHSLATRVYRLPLYLPLIIKAWVQYALRLLSPLEPVDSPFARRFHADGIAGTFLSEPELYEVREMVRPAMEDLLRKKAARAEQTFDSNQQWLDPTSWRSLYSHLHTLMERHGVLATATAYLGRPCAVTHVLLQHNDNKDHYFHTAFEDAGLPEAKTNYYHLDASYDMVKCVLYLTDVDTNSGPFSFVPGTHRLRDGFFVGICRRAVDRSGLASYKLSARQLFMALPKSLRKKGPFGSELLDESPGSKAIIANEYQFTCADGNLGLFDNLGIHRGALVEEGERRVLFLTLS